MVRLEGTKLLVERNSEEDVILARNYELGTAFDIKIEATEGHVRVRHNADQTLNWKIARAGCYFKAGCYTQFNTSKGDAAGSFGEVIIYRLSVEHQ